MKTELDADDINLMTLAQEYSSEPVARKLFEAMRWPGGKPICPHCQHDECYTLKSSRATAKANRIRPGTYCCAACRKAFTATVGTVLESTHLPIAKWMMAIFILCSSKKSVSALQLSRMLKTTYKTAWFMAHRIRHAMMDKPGETEKLTGTVEVDEVFIGGVGDRKTKFSRLTPVVALVQRDGKMHTRVVASVSQNNLGKVLHECVDKSAILNTDEHDGYKPAGKEFAKHESVNHSKEEYHRVNPDGTVTTTNSAESFFALFRRGVHGAWHCVSREHLPKYANEFAFRWSTRKESDGQRMASFMPMIDGKRLLYRQPVN